MSTSAPTPNPAGVFFTLDALGLPTTQAAMLQIALTALQAQFPGYVPSAADLEWVMAQIIASWAADAAQLCTQGATEIFEQFGTQLLQLPVETGTPAQTSVTVTAVDGSGYTLPTYTQINLTLSGVQVGFQTAQQLTIAPGQTTGTVAVIAVASGTAFNGAGNPASPISQINWILGISASASASNGVDQEDPDAYLQRLVNTLQLLAPRPITASDYATLAVNFTPASDTDQEEVGRATAIDGYDPALGTIVNGVPYLTSAVGGAGNTYGNEREVTICITDSFGNPLNDDTAAAVGAYLSSLREVNFVVNVVSPNYTAIYVTVTVGATAGYAPAVVQANVQAAILNYLNPTAFGLPQGAISGWNNTQTIYISRVESAIQLTQGVDFVQSGSLYVDIVNPPANQSDLSILAPFPLPLTTVDTVPTSAITVLT